MTPDAPDCTCGHPKEWRHSRMDLRLAFICDEADCTCGHPKRWHHGPSEYPGTALLCCEGTCKCADYKSVKAEVRAS